MSVPRFSQQILFVAECFAVVEARGFPHAMRAKYDTDHGARKQRRDEQKLKSCKQMEPRWFAEVLDGSRAEERIFKKRGGAGTTRSKSRTGIQKGWLWIPVRLLR